MENIWTYLRSKGCRIASLHPLLDGASEEIIRIVGGEALAEAKAKPPAQPAGGPASSSLSTAGAQLPPVPP
eukprot:47754-Pyramimonas_sp.AAC.1